MEIELILFGGIHKVYLNIAQIVYLALDVEGNKLVVYLNSQASFPITGNMLREESLLSLYETLIIKIMNSQESK